MFEEVHVPILAEDSLIPVYATDGASGCDARANLAQSVEIAPGDVAMIPTGIRVEVPPGYEIQVRPRSGFAAKHRVTVLNSPGTIDADYRGEILVMLINHGKAPFVVEPLMRIAQLVLVPVARAMFVKKESLAASGRGEGRFGHTGAG